MATHYRCTILLLLFFNGYLKQDISAQNDTSSLTTGITSNVEITRDQWGVNHIYANNQHDLFFAQGYCAAKDRLFQFEIWRRQASGTLSEILGDRELKRDIGIRLFRYRGDIKKELNHYHPQGWEIITAYTEGVNAYIDKILQHPDSLPVEFKLLNILPVKWTVQDVISRHQGILRNVSEELNTGRAVAIAGEDSVKKMMWYHPKDPILKMDTAIRPGLLSKDILELYEAFRKEVTFLPGDIIETERSEVAEINNLNAEIKSSLDTGPFKPSLEGSNNWVVSGKRSASGYALLANDPHRKIAVPSLRYIVHLVAPGWNVMGAGEPTIPGVSIGHNEYGAWGVTVFDTDGEDLYVYDLDPQDMTQYHYKNGWKKMDSVKETIPVKNQAPVQVTLRYTIHGPVTYIDSINHKAYAVKAAWLEPGGAPYLASLRIDQAKDWEGFRDACSYHNLPALNIVWADKKGNIGWQVVGITPVRKNFSGLVPIPGDGRYEWSGYLPIKERPHLLNPAKGFIATANQQLTPADYQHWDAIGYTWPDAFRGNRLNKLLGEDTRVTPGKIKAMQTDYFSSPAQALVPMLQTIKMQSLLAQSARKKLLQWNYIMDKNSVGAGIFFMWQQAILNLANKQFLDSPLNQLLTMQLEKIIMFLKNPQQVPYHVFGPNAMKGKNNFLQLSFENAINLLSQKLGSDINDWKLGQKNYRHIQFIHPLAALVKDSVSKTLNSTLLPRSGYAYSIGNTGNTDNQNNGASFRIIADAGDWDKTLMTNTPGQSGNPASKFYLNLFELWAHDQYFPAYFSRKKIEEVSVEKTVLKPLK